MHLIHYISYQEKLNKYVYKNYSYLQNSKWLTLMVCFLSFNIKKVLGLKAISANDLGKHSDDLSNLCM